MPENTATKKRCITDFSNLAAQKWEIVNDGVMGGRSDSSFQINKKGNAVFIGTISLQNNGGFASVRNHESLNLEGFQSLKLHLKGDGKRYCFRLRTADNGGVHRFSYDYRFETEADRWIDVVLPLSGFRPFFRGRPLKDVPSPDLSKIRLYGFLISDKQEGPFRLEVESIWALFSGNQS